jgi:hypothetical protein
MKGKTEKILLLLDQYFCSYKGSETSFVFTSYVQALLLFETCSQEAPSALLTALRNAYLLRR